MEKLEELERKLDKISKKQAEYESTFNSQELDTAKKNISISETTSKSEQQNFLQQMSKDIQLLQKELESLKKWQEVQDLKLDELEQYSRSNCLILHGNPIDNKISNSEVEKYIVNTINSRLELPSKICAADIDICHPLPSKKTTKPIIIKFVRRSIRNMIFANKKNFKVTKGPKLSMTESLTKRRLKIVEEARKYFDFENVWTQKGNVYCSFKGKKHAIYHLSDIHRIRTS